MNCPAPNDSSVDGQLDECFQALKMQLVTEPTQRMLSVSNLLNVSRTLSLNIKLQLYAAVVMSTAIYACETWRSIVKVQKKMFHQQNLPTKDYWSYMKRQGNQQTSVDMEWTEAFT